MRITKLLGIAVSMAIPMCGGSSQEPVALVTPQGLWAAQVNPYTLRLVWNAVPGAGAYRISCGVNGKPDRVLGTMPSGQIATYASGVPRRVAYAMPIRPTDVGTEYRCSLEWGTMTGRFYGKTAFNPVTSVFAATSTKIQGVAGSATATSTSEDEITLTWDPVPGATAYTINREVAPLGFSPFCDMCSTTSTSIVDRFTEKSRKHRYFVTPITAAGAGLRATSNYVVPGVPADTTPIPRGAPMVPPASVTATVTSATSAKASWIAVRGAAAYELTRYIAGAKVQRIMRVPNDLPGVLIEVPEKFVVDPKAAAMPLTVHYSVRSMDATGRLLSEAVTSNTITVSAKEAAAAALATRNVTNPRATTISASSIMLTWTPPSVIVSCNLERSLSGGTFALLSRLPAGAYRYADEMPDLLAKAPHYRIRCGVGKLPMPAVAFPDPAPAA